MDIKINALETVERVIIKELDVLINSCSGAPFIKFLPLVTSIEYLGACADNHPFNINEIDASNKSGITTKRFRDGLKLLGKKYEKYAKSNSKIDFYKDLKCGMVHNLKPTNSKITLSERRHQTNGIPANMSTADDGSVCIILEDFYEDIKCAALKLLETRTKGKLPNNKKVDAPNLRIKTVSTCVYDSFETTGGTESNISE